MLKNLESIKMCKGCEVDLVSETRLLPTAVMGIKYLCQEVSWENRYTYT